MSRLRIVLLSAVTGVLLATGLSTVLASADAGGIVRRRLSSV